MVSLICSIYQFHCLLVLHQISDFWQEHFALFPWSGPHFPIHNLDTITTIHACCWVLVEVVSFFLDFSRSEFVFFPTVRELSSNSTFCLLLELIWFFLKRVGAFFFFFFFFCSYFRFYEAFFDVFFWLDLESGSLEVVLRWLHVMPKKKKTPHIWKFVMQKPNTDNHHLLWHFGYSQIIVWVVSVYPKNWVGLAGRSKKIRIFLHTASWLPNLFS